MEKEKEIIRVALYVRVSTEEQVKYGFSLSSQLNRLTEYCKNNKYKIIDKYVDEGKSARSKLKSRTELLRLIEDAKIKKFDRIIFWRLDRWFRNIADYYKIQEILDKNYVDWECTDEEYNTTTSNGRLHLNIKLSIAQNESDQTSDRIKFNFQNMVKNKRAIFGTNSCVFGFKVVDSKKEKKVIIDNDKKNIVYFIIKHYKINKSFRKTAFLVKEKFDYDITAERIKKMLKSTMLYGCYRDVEGYCENYISKEEFMKIQEILPKTIKQNKKYDYIFSGLLVCGNCNHKMSGSKIKKYHVYRCGYYKNTRNCINKKYIQEYEVEKFLLENIKNIKEREIKTLSLQTINSNKKNYDLEIIKLKKKNDKLAELYIDSKISREKYDSIYNETSEKIKELEKQKNHINKKKEIINLPDNIIEIYNKLNNENKRAFWSKYIDYIIIDLSKNDIQKKYKIILK